MITKNCSELDSKDEVTPDTTYRFVPILETTNRLHFLCVPLRSTLFGSIDEF